MDSAGQEKMGKKEREADAGDSADGVYLSFYKVFRTEAPTM